MARQLVHVHKSVQWCKYAAKSLRQNVLALYKQAAIKHQGSKVQWIA